MKTLITGISGTLGTALGKACLARGEDVVGVGRKEIDVQGRCTTFVANAQRTAEDARVLLDLDVDRIFLCAGQIEEEVGEGTLGQLVRRCWRSRRRVGAARRAASTR